VNTHNARRTKWKVPTENGAIRRARDTGSTKRRRNRRISGRLSAGTLLDVIAMPMTVGGTLLAP